MKLSVDSLFDNINCKDVIDPNNLSTLVNSLKSKNINVLLKMNFLDDSSFTISVTSHSTY